MNGEVKDLPIREKAWGLCKEFLGGTWKEIPLDEFGFFSVSGGLSNTLYRCTLPKKVEKDPHLPTEVLLRIYGPLQDDPNKIVDEAVTFMLLSEKKLGPKLYGLFPAGRLEEFIPSHSLSSDELRQYAPLIAREMAKIHALDVPARKVPDLVPMTFTKWLSEVKEVLQEDNGKYFLSYNDYRTEIEWLITEIAKTNSPVVFCHNDLQGGNVLLREDTTQNGNPNIMLIDFEFGSYNYRGFDLANHLCEWCFDYSTAEYPHFKLDLEKFPSREEQIQFFTSYLDQLSKEGIPPKRPLMEEIESMLNEVNLFVSSAHFLWSLWSAKMTLTSCYGFAHKEHGKTRKELYHVFKERHLACTRNNVNNS